MFCKCVDGCCFLIGSCRCPPVVGPGSTHERSAAFFQAPDIFSLTSSSTFQG